MTTITLDIYESLTNEQLAGLIASMAANTLGMSSGYLKDGDTEVMVEVAVKDSNGVEKYYLLTLEAFKALHSRISNGKIADLFSDEWLYNCKEMLASVEADLANQARSTPCD